jgi:hypothetical protein
VARGPSESLRPFQGVLKLNIIFITISFSFSLSHKGAVSRASRDQMMCDIAMDKR